MTPIIAIANHKGGAGKTTTAHYVAIHLAKTGRRVLAVDLDDQAGLTSRMLFREWKAGRTVADVLLREASIKQASVHADSELPLDLLPADTKLSWAAAKIQAMSPNHLFLARALAQATDYDVILLDCPPSADIIIVNAMMAATHLVMAATPTVESYDGTMRMRAMMFDLAEMTGKAPELLGIVATQVIGNSNSQQSYLAQMKSSLIGCVPMRVGVDAHRAIMDAYDPITARIVAEVERA